ncbi:hypothetical protein FACS189432_03420 [Bacteroidia bacterium]|nr:hypothetical protein FACS189432_03420 [Bacteroidia bacterium]
MNTQCYVTYSIEYSYNKFIKLNKAHYHEKNNIIKHRTNNDRIFSRHSAEQYFITEISGSKRKF